MNQAEIIRMAREAGLLPLLDEDCFQTMGTKNFGATKKVLERFFLAAAAAGAAAEREECAKECEEHWEINGSRTEQEFAAAIRARGQA